MYSLLPVYDLLRAHRARRHETSPDVSGQGGWSWVSSNVVFLGLTSLLTDISSEMVNAILPMYLTLVLQFTPLQFGIFDGLYQGVTVFVRLLGGFVADRYGQYKTVAGAGYALSAGCKLGLLAAGTAWLATAGFLLLDRLGKGVRTAPRDALIALSSPPARRAESFGVHRTLDTVGALLGPVLAFGLLWVLPDAYAAVFMVSFGVALLGLGVLCRFVAPVATTASTGVPRPPIAFRSAFGLLSVSPFRALALAGMLLSLFTVSDAFVYLTLQRRSDISPGVFPLLYVGTALTSLLLAIPIGRMADRVGRRRIFLGGHGLLLGVYGLLLLPSPGLLALAGCLILLGAYYAANDGVLMALASTALPPALLTSGLAILTTGVTLARLMMSVLFGALWTWGGPEWTVLLFVFGLTAALVVATVVLSSYPEESSS